MMRRRIGDELHAVDAVGGAPAHPRARLLGRVDDAFGPAGAGPLIVEDARRDDRVGGAALLFFQRERLRRQLDAADRGDAVRHVELVDVLRLRRLLRVAEMGVQVDEAGHEIHAGAVDDFGPWRGRRCRATRRTPGVPALVMRAMRLRSTTTFIGPNGRRAGAVDHHHVADRQRRERAGAFAGPPIGSGINPSWRASSARTVHTSKAATRYDTVLFIVLHSSLRVINRGMITGFGAET